MYEILQTSDPAPGTRHTRHHQPTSLSDHKPSASRPELRGQRCCLALRIVTSHSERRVGTPSRPLPFRRMGTPARPQPKRPLSPTTDPSNANVRPHSPKAIRTNPVHHRPAQRITQLTQTPFPNLGCAIIDRAIKTNLSNSNQTCRRIGDK